MLSVDATSYLFVPANRPDRYAKAAATGAGAIIIDLEDAIAPADKVQARHALADAWRDDLPALVRINAIDSGWHDDDIAVCRDLGVRDIMVPKACSPDSLAAIAAAVGAPARLYALVETAEGMAAIRQVASVPGVVRLAFGTVDFQLDLDIDDDDEGLLAFRSEFVLASRLARLPAPIDGVTTRFDDAAQVTLDTRRSRRLGFGGKLCIHPSQVAIVNQELTPDADSIAWARRVVEATADGAAVAVDGKMVDRPVLERARRVLARSGQET